MNVWWERYPELFEAEKKALDEYGYTWEITVDLNTSRELKIQVAVPTINGEMILNAEYPDSYPYFPPEVYSDELMFTRHQHLVGKNLCLLARGGEQWRPGHDTLALLLKEQLPLLQKVVEDGADENFIGANEDHVGEAFSSFLPYRSNCSLIVPDETPSLDVSSGRLSVLLKHVGNPESRAGVINGVIETISDANGKPLIKFGVTFSDLNVRRAGFWLRLPERPKVPALNPGQTLENYFASLMLSENPGFKRSFENGKKGDVLVCGFVYADEVSWRGSADDWFFISVTIERERKGMRPVKGDLAFVPADWGGEKACLVRAPMLKPLRKKSVLVVGLGSLGSPLVVQLARAGIGKIYLLDFDYLQVGNTLRWALGWEYAGLGKSEALAAHVAKQYPYTQAFPYKGRLGEPGSSDYQQIHQLAAEVDLIVDATAAQRVNHFLSDLAKGLKKPYVWLTTTSGGAGGVIGRVLPDSLNIGCYHCFSHSLADKVIRLPADGGPDDIQPGGCAQATFIGAGVDTDEIAIAASRLAVATLNRGELDGYRDFSWNVAVADLYEAGNPILPRWTSYPLAIHPKCLACNAHK